MAAENLYPPIIDSYMPAYLNPFGVDWQRCRIYFSLSSLNKDTDILFAQLSLINQKTNKSALNEQRYPSGVKMVRLQSPEKEDENGLYYVDLYVGKTAQGDVYDIEKLETNQYYKAQIRFVSSNIDVITTLPVKPTEEELKK